MTQGGKEGGAAGVVREVWRGKGEEGGSRRLRERERKFHHLLHGIFELLE